MGSSWRARATAWLGRPCGRASTLALGGLLCALPAWLMADRLRPFLLFGDDFAYLAESRTWPRLLASLWTPHNAHVVPLFRAWTFLLVKVAGRLENLPTVIGVASYGILVLTMMAGGHVVAQEARDLTPGLAAMALMGVSTVMEPATVWYSAGQALWSALAILGMLAALQAWRASPRPQWLVLAIGATLAAPWLWSAGLVAGPVGAAYLWADARPRCRRLALVMVGLTALIVLLLLWLRGWMPQASASLHGHTLAEAANPVRGLLHTGQAIVEALLLGNLGHDAETTPAQGVVLSLTLVVAWAWCRRWGRPSPLEAAGAVMVVLGYLVIYIVRGYFSSFSSLRPLGWYHAIPQAGAVVFVAGWALGPQRPERDSAGLRPVRRRGAVGLLALAAVLLIVQVPRANRQLVGQPDRASEGTPRLITAAARRDALRRVREEAAAQARFLTDLDRAEQQARSLGVGRDAIRSEFGRLVGPGMPREAGDLDATDLLDLPRTGTAADPARMRSVLGPLLGRHAERRQQAR